MWNERTFLLFQTIESRQLRPVIVLFRIRDDFHGGEQARRWYVPVQHLCDTVRRRGCETCGLFSSVRARTRRERRVADTIGLHYSRFRGVRVPGVLLFREQQLYVLHHSAPWRVNFPNHEQPQSSQHRRLYARISRSQVVVDAMESAHHARDWLYGDSIERKSG